MLKTPGGLSRVTAVNQNGRLKDVHISGDFFFFPSVKLMDIESSLNDVPLDDEKISQQVENFY
jgi:hypothetical protein